MRTGLLQTRIRMLLEWWSIPKENGINFSGHVEGFGEIYIGCILSCFCVPLLLPCFCIGVDVIFQVVQRRSEV